MYFLVALLFVFVMALCFWDRELLLFGLLDRIV